MVAKEIFDSHHHHLRCSNKEVKKCCQDGCWRRKVALRKVKNRIIQTRIDSNYWYTKLFDSHCTASAGHAPNPPSDVRAAAVSTARIAGRQT